MAIQEARWLISKAKARLHGVLSDGDVDVTNGGMGSAREVQREIDDKMTAIRDVMSKGKRPKAGLDMCDSYAASLAVDEEISSCVRRFYFSASCVSSPYLKVPVFTVLQTTH